MFAKLAGVNPHMVAAESARLPCMHKGKNGWPPVVLQEPYAEDVDSVHAVIGFIHDNTTR